MNKDLAELTTHCIRCGFCLESCPTFSETANELQSPRGRIYLVRSATEGKLNWQDDVRPHLDLCLGCRACETACPSGVQYGSILEMARDKIDKERPNHARNALLKGVTHPTLLKTNLLLGSLLPGKRVPLPLSKLVSGRSAEAERPQPQPTGTLPPLEASILPTIKGQVYLLEGCAMKVLFPRVHEATRRLLRRVGYTVKEVPQGCCGAMDVHNAQLENGARLAKSLIASMPDDIPVVVNSAGCGSTMKEYGDHVPGGEVFAKRVVDITEFLLSNGLEQLLESSGRLDRDVTYHDACHLAHGQKIRLQPRALIKSIPGVRFHELQEADTCCGSAGIYNVTQPTMARALLERKWRNVEHTKASIVATGNPGCHAWIAQAGREHGKKVAVLHTAELLEAAFIGIEKFVD